MLKLHNARFAVSVVLQVELHVDELLISAYTRIEAFRVSPVFNKAQFFIKRNRACIIRDNVELQLSIYPASLAHSMHASVSARPKPSPQNSLAMPIPNSALCFVLYLFPTASIPAVPAILPSTTAMISISLLLSVFALRNAPSCSTVKLFSSG